MIIGIDGNEANVNNRVGVNQYAFEILCYIYQELAKPKNNHGVIVFLNGLPTEDLPKETKYWKYKVLPGKRVWTLTKLMPHLLVNKEKLDCFFSPSHYLPLLTIMPKVCTIHDLGYLKFSGQFKKYDYWQLKYWTAISIIVSKAIISVSNRTKQDIVRHYPFARNKVQTIYHGYDKNRFNNKVPKKDVRRIKGKYGIVNDYVLFLSTLKPSKNITGILEAFKQLLDHYPSTISHSDIKLVIAGKKGWLYQSIFREIKRLRLGDRVIFTGFVPEQDKPALLTGAKVFVSPSFWEGFGMHVLEAMACGVPVVVSRVASLPEVVEKAGVYVDEKNADDIAKGIKKVLIMSPSRYNKQVQAGFLQAEKFSWEKAAKETLRVLEKTVK